jgi:hypothetical protein
MSGLDGRGRWTRWNKKDTTEDCLHLDMRRFSELVDLTFSYSGSWIWTRNNYFGEHKSTISYAIFPGRGVKLSYTVGEKSYEYLVSVDKTQPNYGGVRYWWICPNQNCKRRVRILYLRGGYFLCRHCQNLTYKSSQAGDDLSGRIIDQMYAIRRKLGADGGIVDPLPDKPKGMQNRTYFRLLAQYRKLNELQSSSLAVHLHRFVKLDTLDDDFYEMLPKVADYLHQDWREYRQDKKGEQALREFGGHLAARLFDDEPEEQEPPPRYTLGEIATLAGVPYAFAQEAKQEGLIREDAGRTKRRKRYRERLKNWLGKLHQLREAGLSWEEIRDWSKRRWLPGHEQERVLPDTLSLKSSL